MERIFRGKTPSQDEHFDDGEWVEGYYTCFNGKEHRIYSGYAETDCGYYYPDWFNVRPETVGQYTGLTDKNGKKIFEGDIVNEYDMPEEISNTGIVQWSEMFMGWHISQTRCMYCHEFMSYEVIGNIHDNPELLEVK